MAAVLDIEIDQGATWKRRLYVATKKILTAKVSSSVHIIGTTSIVLSPGGIGSVSAGDLVTFSADPTKSYSVSTGVADLAAGGTMVLSSPVEINLEGGTMDVYTPVDLTGATFASQIRTYADDTTVTATVTGTLALDPTDGYFDLSISAPSTEAISTEGKKTYDKKAKFTWDGELTLSGEVIRAYNGTVMVSPGTTR